MLNSTNNGRVLLSRRVWGTDTPKPGSARPDEHLRASHGQPPSGCLQESDSRDGPCHLSCWRREMSHRGVMDGGEVKLASFGASEAGELKRAVRTEGVMAMRRYPQASNYRECK